MNLRLLWLASLAIVLLGLSGAPLEKGWCLDPNGCCKPPGQGGSASTDGGFIDPNG